MGKIYFQGSYGTDSYLAALSIEPNAEIFFVRHLTNVF